MGRQPPIRPSSSFDPCGPNPMVRGVPIAGPGGQSLRAPLRSLAGGPGLAELTVGRTGSLTGWAPCQLVPLRLNRLARDARRRCRESWTTSFQPEPSPRRISRRTPLLPPSLLIRLRRQPLRRRDPHRERGFERERVPPPLDRLTTIVSESPWGLGNSSGCDEYNRGLHVRNQ